MMQGYEKFGLNVNEKGDITYREWAPGANEAYLIGDFSMLDPKRERVNPS
jgi:1,4-alpha-glucan branching enzyme